MLTTEERITAPWPVEVTRLPFPPKSPPEPVSGEGSVAASAPVDDRLAETERLLDRALRIIAEFEKPSRRRRPSRGRVTAHLPGQHNQQSHGNSVSSPNALDGIDVLDADEYHRQYGDVQDDSGVDLAVEGETRDLTVRYFESGDMHIAIDLEDGKTQVLEDMDSESIRRLAYDIEDILAVDETEFEHDDPYQIVADVDSEKHNFNVGKNGVGDIRVRPLETEDWLELSPEQAGDFVNALLDMADAYEEHFDGAVEVEAKAHRRKVTAHLKGLHDQKDHGRKGLGGLPKATAPKAAPAKKAPAPGKKAAPKAPDSDVAQARLKLDRAVQMHGSDRSKWPKKDRDAAAKLDKLVGDGGAAPKAPASKRTAPKPQPAPETKSAAKPAAEVKPPPAKKAAPKAQEPKTERQLAAEAHIKTLTDGLPTSLRKPVADALNAQAKLAPGTVMKLRGLGFDDLGGGLAEYKHPAGVINLNNQWKTNKRGLDAAAKSSHADGYLAPTGAATPVGAVIAHEFGHRVAFRFIDPNAPGVPRRVSDKLFGALSTSLGVRPPSSPNGVLTPYPAIKNWMTSNRFAISGNVSEYAAESFHELLGEIWQEFSTQGDKARPVAQVVGKAMLSLAEGGAS